MKIFILGMLFVLTSCTHAPAGNFYHNHHHGGVAAQQAADAAATAAQTAQPPMHFFSP